MAKKSSGKSKAGKPKAGDTVAQHRKMAETLYAKARIHSAKADLAEAEALSPPKAGSMKRGFSC
jgi:hypothetical protein